jgi:hypothetical protein
MLQRVERLSLLCMPPPPPCCAHLRYACQCARAISLHTYRRISVIKIARDARSCCYLSQWRSRQTSLCFLMRATLRFLLLTRLFLPRAWCCGASGLLFHRLKLRAGTAVLRDGCSYGKSEGKRVFSRVLVLIQTVTRHQLAIGTDRAVAMSLSDAPLGSRSADTLNKATTSVIMYAAHCMPYASLARPPCHFAAHALALACPVECCCSARTEHRHDFLSLATPFFSIALLFIRCRALTGCPDNRIKDCVEALSPPQQSLLMQYIYRGMAQRNEVTSSLQSYACSCYIVHLLLQSVSNVLLKWHAAVVAAAGEGCIVRYAALLHRPPPPSSPCCAAPCQPGLLFSTYPACPKNSMRAHAAAKASH